MPDWMHTVCIGVLQYLEGCITWELFVKVGGKVTKPQEALDVLYDMICISAADLGLDRPFAQLTLSMFRRKKVRPRMALKATEGRMYLPILTYMVVKFFPPADEYERLRLDCLRSMVRCYWELRNWIDAESPARLKKEGRKFLILYMELHHRTSDYLYHVYPKHHLFAHVTDTAVNPASLWNYSDEDEIGQCAELAAACNVAWLHEGLIERYRCKITE